MANNAIETVMGAVVLTVAGGFLYFAYNSSNIKSVDGYSIRADFTNIAGIGLGSDVRVGGIKVGVVEDLSLDNKSFQAVAKMRIDENVKLPADSTAAIQSDGLLGSKFVALEPGGDDKNMEEGDVITFTQSAVSLEEMIGKFVFSGGGVDGDDAAPTNDTPASEGDNPFSLGIE